MLKPWPLSAIAVSAAVSLAAGTAGAQVTLTNCSIPFTPGASVEVSPEPGFGPGEIAATVLDIPQELLPIRVTSVSIFWYSQFYALFGPAPTTVQEDILLYLGEPPNAPIIGQLEAPQLTDGVWNIYINEVAAQNIIIQSGTKLTVGIRMDMTPLHEGGQAPGGDAFSAAPAYDLTSTTAKRNPVFLTSTVNTVNGPRSGWLDYNDIRNSNGTRRTNQGWDIGIRITVEHVDLPPACIADLATAGNPDPQAGGDGFLTGDDFDLFINAFFTEIRRTSDNSLIADLTDGAGSGPPDGFLTGADFDRFIGAFFEGC